MSFLHLAIVFLSFSVCIPISSANTIRILDGIEHTLKRVTGYTFIEFVFQSLLGKNATLPPPERRPRTAIPLPFPISLTTPPIAEAEHYVHFAAASYCEGRRLRDWTCKECMDTGPQTYMHKVIKNIPAGTQGFIALDHGKQEIILAFRGTHNFINWNHQDILFEIIPSPLRDGAGIHKGFMKATMSLYSQVLPIMRNLTNQHPTWRVVVTGHSLGGSMTILTYYLLSHDLPKVNYAVFTYGEPRTGDKAFADIINSRNIPLARLVNENDFAPHGGLAVSQWLVHHGTEYWTHKGVTRICSREVYEDPACSSSLQTSEQLLSGHVKYFGVFIGLNCLEENPLGQLRTILYYRKRNK